MSPRSARFDHARPSQRRQHRTDRLQLEQLEDRLLLTAFSWNTDNDGFWDVAANWSPQQVPGGGDDVTIDRGAANPTITISDPRTVNTIVSRESLVVAATGSFRIDTASQIDGPVSIAGGTLDAGGTVTLAGPTTWSGGTITGGAGTVVAAGATMTIEGAGGKAKNGQPLSIAGTVNHTGGGQFDANAGIVIEAGGVYDLQGDFTISAFGVISNSGTFKKSAGAGESLIDKQFNISGGTVEAQSGQLSLARGSTSTGGGSLNASPGAVLNLKGATTFDMSGTYTGSGGGRVEFSGSSMFVNVPGVTVNFPAGLFHWTGGSIGPAFNRPFTNSGSMTLSGNTNRHFGGSDFFNTGTIIMTDAGTATGGGLTNRAGATFDFQGDGDFTSGAFFTNFGTVKKTGGSGESRIDWPYNQTGGTIDVQSGKLTLGSGGVRDGGTFMASMGATLDLTGGSTSPAYKGTFTGSGAGRVELASGTLNTDTPGLTLDFDPGLFQWTGGSIGAHSSRPVTNNGQITLSGDNPRSLFGPIFITNGASVIHRDAGSLDLVGSPSSLEIESGGLYEIQSDADTTSIGEINVKAGGTLRKSGGTGESRLASRVNVLGGTIDVQTGKLTLAGANAVSTGGTFDVSPGATLDLTGGASVTYGGTYMGMGAGRVEFSGGALTTADPGATFDLPGDMFHWTGGGLDAGGSRPFTNAGTMTLSGPNGKALFRTLLINTGTIVMSTGSGDLDLAADFHGSTIENRAGATFELRGDLNVGDPLDNPGQFINEGTLRKTAGSGAARLAGSFNSRPGGVVEVQSGRLQFARGGTSTGGTFNVSAGAVLEFACKDPVFCDAFNLTGPYVGSGPGTIEFSALLGGNDATNPARLNFPPGVFRIIGGQLIGDMINDGTFDFAPAVGLFTRAAITNNGTWIHSGAGDFVLNANSRFTNNGLYDLQTDADLVSPNDGSGGTVFVVNTGTFRKSGGLATSNFRHDGFGRAVQLDNTGTLEVQSGTLSFDDGSPQFTGSTLAAGTWIARPFSTISAPNASNFTTNNAAVTLDGPNSDFARINTLATNNGSFTLAGGRDFTRTGNLTNSGQINVGPGSILTVTGTFTDNANSLNIDIGGRPRTGQFGRVNVGGVATLNGTLNINRVGGFGPTPNDVYQIMTFASHVGSFSQINGLLPFFDAAVNATNVTLTVRPDAPTYDLDVDTIMVPLGGRPGENATINYTVQNLSANDLGGTWFDSLYLSRDITYSPDDLLIGRVEHLGGVAALSAYNESLQAPLPAVTDGDYHVIVIADSRGLVPDTDRLNNTAASAGTLHSSVMPLEFGATASGTIENGQNVHFRIDVPLGGDVVVNANFEVPQQAELFVRFRDLPTRSEFDFTASNPLELDRTIRMASPTPGSYYVLIHGREGAGNGQPFELTTRRVEFELADATPIRGTNAGPATLTLRGSGFTEASTANLIGPDGGPTLGGVVRLLDPNTLLATFDLAAAPAGLYEIQVTDGARTDTLVNGFEVATGSPGRLQVQVLMPGRVRAGRVFTAFIDYANVGGSDFIAPLMFVTSPSSSPFTLDATAEPSNTRQQFLGVNDDAPAGVLPPGANARVPVRMLASAFTNELEVSFVDASSTEPMDWQEVRDDLRTLAATQSNFNAVFAQLMTQTGTTWGDYVRMLARNATVLPASLGDRHNPLDLVRLELRRAEAAITTSLRGRVTAPNLDVDLSDIHVTASRPGTGEAFTSPLLADGSFILPNVAPGEYGFHVGGVLVTGTDPDPVIVQAGQQLTEVTIEVRPASSLFGTIAAQNGDAIGDAAIYLFKDGQPAASSILLPSGAFYVPELEAGAYTVLVEAAGYERNWIEGVQVVDRPVELHVQMATESRIIGSAVSGGRPAANLFVFAIHDTGLPLARFSGTASDGSFAIGSLPPGVYDVTLIAGDRIRTLADVQVADDSMLDLGEFNLDEGRAAARFARSTSDPGIIAALTAAEIFVRDSWLPFALAKYGTQTAYVWTQYIDGSSTNPPPRQFFGTGSEVVEGTIPVPVVGQAPVGLIDLLSLKLSTDSLDTLGFRDSRSVDPNIFNFIHQSILKEIKQRFEQGQETCEELQDQQVIVIPFKDFGYSDLASLFRDGRLKRDPSGGLEMNTNYGLPFEIPGNLAGGIGMSSPHEPMSGVGQQFDDKRLVDGFVTITPRGKNSVFVNFLVDVMVDDTVDFLPGDLSNGIERIFTVPMSMLERYDWAFDVPFQAKYTPLDDFPDRELSFTRQPNDDDCEDDDPPDPNRNPGGRGGAGIVLSTDPNDKQTIGVTNPAGDPATQFVREATPLAYTIHFENLVTATAPAQEVFVTDSLNQNLDLSTFQFGDFGFGDVLVDVPDGLQFYNTRLDLTASLGFFVDVEASLDANTRVASWTFRANDPETGDLIADPLAGFLPPNVNSPEGEGFVSFTVQPRADLANDTSITNQALIVFDVNEPLATNSVTTKIDEAAPTSTISSLPAFSPANIPVSWSGTDDAGGPTGSGIAFFDIFVSIDGGSFMPWMINTPAMGGTYPGEAGRTYAFFAVATDNVGHREDMPAGAQAVTTVDATPPTLANVPSDQVVPATSAAGAVVNFPLPTATDDVDVAVAVSCDPASGSIFPVGATKVICTGTDDAGNSATVSFNVIVEEPDATADCRKKLVASSVVPGSGNVTARVTAGRLSIIGGKLLNNIRIEAGPEPSSYCITGNEGTTVNGKLEPLIVTGVTDSVIIGMRGRRDSIFFDGSLQPITLPGDLNVRMNSEGDTLRFDHVTVAGKTRIRTGRGRDLVELVDTVLTGRSSIFTGRGDDTLRVHDSQFLSDILFHGYLGIDSLDAGTRRRPNSNGNLFARLPRVEFERSLS